MPRRLFPVRSPPARAICLLLVGLASTPGAFDRALAADASLADPGATGRPSAVDVAAGRIDPERVMDAADRRHLLLRTGIGVTAEALVALEGLTRAEGIARVIAGLSTTPHRPMPDWTRAPPPHAHAWPDLSSAERGRFERARDRELGELRLWWTREMLETPSPQTERLVLLWHDLFATSYHGTDRGSLAMATQNATFRRLGTGSWETLLKAMIRDAALLRFLDGDANRAASPNENLARELLELFTLGEGHYTQSDVGEAARALTGHAASDVAGLPFRLRTWDHDAGEKTLFGVSGAHDGDALVELALAQPAAPRHLAARFWQAFVADGEPDAAWLDDVAGRFRASGLDIATLYRDTLSSAAFWDPAHRGALVRSPLDLAIGTARALDYPKRHHRSLPRWLADLGMDLFAPPDVAGWREGDAFVTSGALLERERMVTRLVAPPSDPDEGLASSAPGNATDGAAGMAGDVDTAGTMAAAGDDTGDRRGANGDGMAAGTSMADAPPPLEVRLAAEHYRGSAAWRVSLRAGDETLWTDLARTLENGHDTERDGRLGGAADRPWRDVTLPAPPAAVARADTVVVEFLNDAAGSDGDRNLYVDGARLGGVWLDATRARQAGDCVPENPIDAGSLYCGGRVELSLEPATSAATAPLPDYRAAAAHVRWANADGDGGRHVAGIALDDVVTPVGAFHRVQFRLVALEEGGTEIEIDAFDCVPDCIGAWPDCAWRDEGFPAGRMVSFPIDGAPDSAREPCHLNGVGDAERELLAALARSAPSLVEHLLRRPSGEAHASTLRALGARLDRFAGEGDRSTIAGARSVGEGDGRGGGDLPAAVTDGGARPGWIGGPGERFVVDAAFAPPDAPSTSPPAPSIRAPTPARAVEAFERLGLDVAELLLGGFPDESLATLARRDGEDALAAIRRIVAHPAFQVR